VATIAGASGDEIWFNSGDERVYFGTDPMAVVDPETNHVVTFISTGPTHSVAADSENNHIFVPRYHFGREGIYRERRPRRRERQVARQRHFRSR